MKRETVEEILAEQGLSPDEEGMGPLPEGAKATVLFGAAHMTALPDVIRLLPRDNYLVAETRRGGKTYIEYEAIRGLTFETRDSPGTRTGFV